MKPEPGKPHGGVLVSRAVEEEARREWLEMAPSLASISLEPADVRDVELIAVGAFSPLTGFMVSHDYNSVLENMRLSSGLVWPIPITLPVSRHQASRIREGERAVLAGPDGQWIAGISVREIYGRDKRREARLVYGTVDPGHPGVARLYRREDVLVGGEVCLINRPSPAFPCYNLDPAETRSIFREKGWQTVAGFQTRNPIHRAHEYIQKCALEMVDGLFIHPLVGETKVDDLPAAARVASYEVLLREYYPRERVLLAVFPSWMRYAGPREAVFHAIVRKNYGCTHFVVGRDHAGVGSYYGPYDAQRIFRDLGEEELGITPMFFEQAFYCRRCQGMATSKTCPHDGESRLSLSGTRLRQMLRRGEHVPEEYSRPEAVRILRDAEGGGEADWR